MHRPILAIALGLSACHTLAAPQVVTTIKPLHSLVAQVMDGVGEPVLLIKQGSPHGYQSKPSDVQAIAKADLVIYVSPTLETFVPPLIKKGQKNHIEWLAIPGLDKLKTRSGGLWEEHDHAHDHGHDHKHDHSHDHGHDHKHDHSHDHGHDHHDHVHGEFNDHLWLGTQAAKTLLPAVAAELSRLDPDNKTRYESNLQQALAELDSRQQRIHARLADVRDKPYMVFHDAYPYFEHENGLQPIGVVRVDPEHEPGAKRIGELHQIMQDNKIVCLFNEPQFSSKITAKLVEGTQVRIGTLDPLGAELKAGKSLHGELLDNLTQNLHDCLHGK